MTALCHMSIGLLGVALCASCGGKVRTDREMLYELVLSNELHEEHACRDILRPINLYISEELRSALWRRIEYAEIDKVSRCLHQVEEYNTCYSNLDCDALAEGVYPAWALGRNMAPCGCGVSDRNRLSSPLAVPLFEGLNACSLILPIAWGYESLPSCTE